MSKKRKKNCLYHVAGFGIGYCKEKELVTALRALADAFERGGLPAILPKNVVTGLVDPGGGGPCAPDFVDLKIPTNPPNPSARCKAC